MPVTRPVTSAHYISQNPPWLTPAHSPQSMHLSLASSVGLDKPAPSTQNIVWSRLWQVGLSLCSHLRSPTWTLCKFAVFIAFFPSAQWILPWEERDNSITQSTIKFLIRSRYSPVNHLLLIVELTWSLYLTPYPTCDLPQSSSSSASLSPLWKREEEINLHIYLPVACMCWTLLEPALPYLCVPLMVFPVWCDTNVPFKKHFFL